jgi:hypothetical protein
VADGRFFDREQVAHVADVWDNNTYPLFGVALSHFHRDGAGHGRVREVGVDIGRGSR